jgi:hypothetical protein
MTDPDKTAADQAREALIANLISYGVQLAILIAVSVALRNKGWFEHQAWALRQRAQARETRQDAEFRQYRRGLHDDIRRMEYPEAGTWETG